MLKIVFTKAELYPCFPHAPHDMTEQHIKPPLYQGTDNIIILYKLN